MHLIFSTWIDETIPSNSRNERNEKKKKPKKCGKSIYHSDRFNSSNTIESHLNDSKFISQNESNWNAFFFYFRFTLWVPMRDDVMNSMKWFFFGCIYFSKSRQTERHQISRLNGKIAKLIKRIQSKQKKNASILFVLYVFINMDVGRLMNIRIRYTMSFVH